MNWLKRKICGWLGVERYEDWGDAIESSPKCSPREAPTFFDRNPETNFRIYNASGGVILEVTRWDKTRSEWNTNMHIIHDDDENKTESIAKIMTYELMR